MTKPRVCVTVTGRSMEELRRARDAAQYADLVELRLDFVDRPDVAGALEGRRAPVIVTCRASWEGGHFSGSEDQRRRILESALELGAEFVDVEAAADFAPAIVRATGGRRVVMSSHVFAEMPSDLGPRFARLRATGAEIAKLAVAVNSLAETLPLFDLGARASTDGWRGHILIGMGNPGVVTRILAGRLGNRWTYAGDSVAPGQLSAARLVNEFRVRTIDTATQLFGVVGNPVMHSRSPIMHNAGFAAVGMNAVYLPLEGRDAADVVTFARAMSVQGLSITAPFKIPLMAHVAKVEPLAEQVGAINTIGSRHGAWTGTNTDVEGFLRPLDRRMSLAGTRVCVIGSGGAARAAALGLASRQARVSISARRTEAAHAIAELAGGSVAAFPPAPSTWDVLVNSTPLGSTSTPGDPTAGAALDGRLVYDLVYAPEQTELLARAAASGCEIIGGLEMLVAQAERQFEFWTGQQPPAGLFDAASRGMDTSSFTTRLTRQTT